MGTPDSETLPGFTSFSEEFGFEPNRSPIKVWGFVLLYPWKDTLQFFVHHRSCEIIDLYISFENTKILK